MRLTILFAIGSSRLVSCMTVEYNIVSRINTKLVDVGAGNGFLTYLLTAVSVGVIYRQLPTTNELIH